jgi:hypothetical protein
MAAEPPFHRGSLKKKTCSVCFRFHCTYPVVFTMGEKVPFQPLFKNIGEKLAFQESRFSATFSPLFKDPVSGHGLLSNKLTWVNSWIRAGRLDS